MHCVNGDLCVPDLVGLFSVRAASAPPTPTAHSAVSIGALIHTAVKGHLLPALGDLSVQAAGVHPVAGHLQK